MMATRNVEPEFEIAIVGCGRWLRQDDQVGLMVARELAHHPPVGCRIVVTESPAADLVEAAEGARLLIVIDAMRSDDVHPPGSWTRFPYRTERARLRYRSRGDTHALGVDLALATAESLGALPAETWIYAIAAGDCGYGEELSPDVAAAVSSVVHAIESDLQKFLADQARDARSAREQCRA